MFTIYISLKTEGINHFLQLRQENATTKNEGIKFPRNLLLPFTTYIYCIKNFPSVEQFHKQKILILPLIN